MNWDSTISVDGVRYSVPHQLVDTRVWARFHGDELIVTAVDADGPTEVARHPRSVPGRPSITDAHYPPKANRGGDRTPRANTAEEAAFLALGPGAAVEAGMTVAWFTIEDLGAMVRRHRADDSMARAVTRLIRTDLIIIDDIGLLPVSPDAAEGFYRLVDAAPTSDGVWRCPAIFIRAASTRSCPRPWPPRPSTGSCTTPTSL